MSYTYSNPVSFLLALASNTILTPSFTYFIVMLLKSVPALTKIPDNLRRTVKERNLLVQLTSGPSCGSSRKYPAVHWHELAATSSV